MFRTFRCLGACALAFLASSAVAADSVEVTSGAASLNWDGSLAGLVISSSDSQFRSEYHGSPVVGFSGGATVDFSTTIPFANDGNHPLSVAFHGNQFPQSWLSGSMTIAAQTFVAPHVNGNGSTFQTFTTQFTMTGTITAWPTSSRTGTPFFSTPLSGGGVASATYRVVGDSYVMNSGATVFTFNAIVPQPWHSIDIGEVGEPGDATFLNGIFSITGAGHDIWGTSDSFHYVYQTTPGDIEIVVRVNSEQDTNTFAKAGAMLRQTTDPAAAATLIDVRPNGVIEFMHRTNPGESMEWTAGADAAVPIWLRLARHGAFVTGYYSSDGAAWTEVGPAVLTFGGPGLVGMAVTSHDSPRTNTATFTDVSTSLLPAPWTQTDVGAVGTPGQASESNGTFSVSGAGSDIWGVADAFTAVTQPMSGDGDVVARVVGEQHTDMFAKAGVTLGTLSPSSARVILDVKPDGGVEFMARLADGAAMSFLSGAAAAFPVYLRLSRIGAQVNAFIGADGSVWQPVGSVQLALPSTTAAGVAVTSHDPAVLNTAAFDHLSAGAVVPAGANLIVNGGFEQSMVPATGPGWISDTIRQTPAASESVKPRSGVNDGACRTSSALDCGLYQDIVIPVSGAYTLTIYAAASGPGASVGWNVNGALIASSNIAASDYLAVTFSHPLTAGDTVRVWLYSSASPGWAAIDDVSLLAGR